MKIWMDQVQGKIAMVNDSSAFIHTSNKFLVVFSRTTLKKKKDDMYLKAKIKSPFSKEFYT